MSTRLSDPKLRPLYFLGFSILIQVICFSVGAVLLWIEQRWSLDISPWIMLGLVSLCGLLLALFAKFPTAWCAFNFLLIPCIVAYVSLAMPSGLLLAALAVCVLIYLPVIWTGVPYYPTSAKMYEVVAGVLADKGEFSMIDLGCGFGGLLSFLSARFPHSKLYGVEIGPLPWFVCKVRFIARPSVQIRFKSFWELNLADYDVVYAFLAPGPMARLWEKVQAEMRPGSLFLTNSFEVGAKADQVLPSGDGRNSALHVFKIA